MRILFLSPRNPFPPTEGARIKAYNVIKGLYDRGHEVHLVAYALDPADRLASNRAEIGKICASTNILSIKTPRFTSRQELRTVPLNDILLILLNKRIGNGVYDIAREVKPDLVHFDTIQSTSHVKSLCTLCPCIASINDCYSLVQRENMYIGLHPSFGSVFRSIYSPLAFAYSSWYEQRIYEKFQGVHVVSEMDRSYLREVSPRSVVHVIPNGVDTDFFRPLDLSENQHSLAIISNFSVYEHANNALFFIKRVYERIKKIVPDVSLYLVGRDPQAPLLHEARKDRSIHITGFVQDIRPYIDKSSLIVDLRRERFGILNHILQALSMAKCVVGTENSFRAIRGSKGDEQVVIADSKEDFSDRISTLLLDEKERTRIGRNARQLMVSSFNWNSIIREYERMYQQSIELYETQPVK